MPRQAPSAASQLEQRQPPRGVRLEQWQELFPEARTVELGGASHFLVEDDPDGVTGAIGSFLR